MATGGLWIGQHLWYEGPPQGDLVKAGGCIHWWQWSRVKMIKMWVFSACSILGYHGAMGCPIFHWNLYRNSLLVETCWNCSQSSCRFGSNEDPVLSWGSLPAASTSWWFTSLKYHWSVWVSLSEFGIHICFVTDNPPLRAYTWARQDELPSQEDKPTAQEIHDYAGSLNAFNQLSWPQMSWKHITLLRVILTLTIFSDIVSDKPSGHGIYIFKYIWYIIVLYI